ncbi:MAG TPA: endonuclease/exonuclease/phosphatase family protein [Solirubrobacterales bacterium]|jgi:endonuclease/exonuclease/phosphatase family metal-dependent hydrolase|nr:endonuclease/exonuclease/phosphatase family protein [Solirubrobacterales bacterium]
MHVHLPVRRTVVLLAVAAALTLGLLPSLATAKRPGSSQGNGKSQETTKEVNVMTRNLYLGADLAPAISASGLTAFTEATGQILREVTANSFPTRAKGLAQEILKKKPDLVGLQEVALWRTGPPSLEVFLNSGAKPTAETVRYDYLKELMAQLNKGKGKPQYRVAVSQDEFDFEAPANENGVAGDGPNGAIPNAEINGRLTMRDVILVRNGAGVTFKHPQAAHFANLLVVTVSGVKLAVTRGWVAIDAKVRGSHTFRFVNTHLEAFDPATQVPSIRALQAGELVAPGGPATTSLPVVLVGDLNSDDDTVEPGDQQAYRTLLGAGMRERSTNTPLGCCLNSSLLAVGAGGSVADFNHQVDHVMTRDPKEIKLKASFVTGRQPVNGFWDSDHAGLFSSLRFKR